MGESPWKGWAWGGMAFRLTKVWQIIKQEWLNPRWKSGTISFQKLPQAKSRRIKTGSPLTTRFRL
jgi:hypothetical protein